MNIKKIIIPLLLILFMASIAAFGAPVYVNVGPTTEFDGDIKILSEIVAEGVTPDDHETTIFFTDPTADRTITIPDFDVTLGTAILLTVTDNEATAENNAILFTSGGELAGGVFGIESDGDFYYNPSDGSLHATLLYGDGTNLTGVGAAAATALTISAKATENIDKGEAVYVSGAVGPFAQVSLADNTDAAKHYLCGVAAETKTTGQTILIRVRGELTGFNTTAWAEGDVMYLSTAGAMTNVKPTSGAVEIIGYITYDNAAGSMVILHHSAHGIHAPSTDDIVIRMGDSIGAKKVYFKDYANVEVAFIDSDGKADFTSLTLDNPLLPAEGGTGIANAANNTITFTGNFTLGITLTANTTVTFPTTGILVSDATDCTDIEGTGLSIAGGVLNWAAPNESIDSDAYVDASIDHEHLHNDVIHGMTVATPLAAADEIMFWDETAGNLRKITWTNFMGSITTVGTIGGGTWQGGVIGPAYGGTGVANNAASTITISGNFATTLTVTEATGVTLPASGTLYGTLADSISSANLLSSMSDETGTGALVFGTAPTFTTSIETPIINLTGGQIAFPSDVAVSADANTLDDYEEGTYTMTITCVTSGTITIKSTADLCSYTKVGRLVHIIGRVDIDSIDTPIGFLNFSLPFTSASLAEYSGVTAGSITAGSLDFTADYLSIYVPEGSTFFRINGIIDNAGWDTMEGADLSGAEIFVFSFSYFVD